MEVGPQYKYDDQFKAAARLHQSEYRRRVLKVDCADYGNRLRDDDGRALLNYYDGLGIREALRQRFPDYSRKRDADLLRSEHIPFNMLAPLADRPLLMQIVLKEAFGMDIRPPFRMKLEWAPSPARDYLDDLTSFDAYVQGIDANGEKTGIGIEVKYTERSYSIGKSEDKRIKDSESTYWVTTRESGFFAPGRWDELAEDDLRQIWRNHLLGLAMIRNRDIGKFMSVTLYPAGNHHFRDAMMKYRSHLEAPVREYVRGCTFEHYVDCLRGDNEIDAWKKYLRGRYLFEIPAKYGDVTHVFEENYG